MGFPTSQWVVNEVVVALIVEGLMVLSGSQAAGELGGWLSLGSNKDEREVEWFTVGVGVSRVCCLDRVARLRCPVGVWWGSLRSIV